MNKNQTVTYIYNRILFSFTKGGCALCDTREGLEDTIKATGREHAVSEEFKPTGAEGRTVITERSEGNPVRWGDPRVCSGHPSLKHRNLVYFYHANERLEEPYVHQNQISVGVHIS